ncbi:MAG: MFS transporter [Candidatus Brevundimonas colombiensis]|uniref:MFS transporter n=1 Tax=Candidatus Brevundimonas colombiensis TaxID=3121376 RepID=A0AAJ5X1T4_9CAUL|nr:MFS transporter [Brevundimonas sp.]WEK38595.1 MAG: MFS transporter [Brevundimonas sp.]
MTQAALAPESPKLSRGAVALVLVALAMGGFAIGVTEFAAMSILPDFAAGLGVDAPTAGHVISAYAAGVVVGAPILAVLGARLPRWRLLIGFMALFAIGNVASALAPTYGWMLVFRFLSGLPHGAYFGVAALVAASVVPLHFRTRAVSTILMGLTVGTVLGVPVVNIISHAYGWRWTFAIVGVLAVATMALVALFAPRDPAHPDASPWRELGALKRGQVWLTLGVGAVGFGGMFAVYAYLASTLQAVTGAGADVMPWVFAVFGVGMFMGNILGAWAADHVGFKAAGGLLLWSAAALALYPMAAPHLWAMMIVVFLIGAGGGLGSILQTRLMDVAGDAQTLAAALNHSAFNTANAIGPLLGGIAIAAGYGWTSTAWVGVGLSLGGFAIFVVAWLTGRANGPD